MRNTRPALPALILLLSAVGLGVPASSAQSKATTTAKKKSSASSTTTASTKSSATKSSSKNASSKPVPAKGPSAKKTANGSTTKSSARSGASTASRAGKKTTGRSRRQPGQKTPTTDRVSEIQAALAKDGSFQGMPNGKWDNDTAQAMRKFQSAHGLNPTGRLDALTLQKLGLGSQTAGVAAPTPPPGAVSRLTSSVVSPSSTTETARRQ